MGGGKWSEHEFFTRSVERESTGTSFKHNDEVKQGIVTTACHPTMDPRGVRVRESRDSEEHPESNAVMVWLDVTGSMYRMPKTIQRRLNDLMTKLTTHNYLPHPQVLVGAIGDADKGDRAPVQVGQFESDARVDDHLQNIYMEGGGGGGGEESYELGLYFTARHTSIDCYEKRGRKGTIFIIGDEMPYPEVNPRLVQEVFGDEIGQPINTMELLREVKERYHVFFVYMTAGANARPRVQAAWTSLLGYHVLPLVNDEATCELIAATVGLNEGTVTLEQALANITDRDLRGAVRATLTNFDSALHSESSDRVTRL